MAKPFTLAIGENALHLRAARQTPLTPRRRWMAPASSGRGERGADGLADCRCVTAKSLANVDGAFRCLTIDLKVRPIHHRTADRVRAHIFLCMLAYYVEWHMREAWAPLMFADTEQLAKATRDPVAPATRSKAALAKAARHTLDDGTPVHSFSTLMAELATIVRNTCRTPQAGPEAPTFELLTNAQPLHLRALALVQNIKP
ncbi:hypothetical protein [Variovorax sp. WS11]|uniref:hypothetical protein n=1 Tax=Variovorax sp. WS11 TaxID=1105204 RepID=UPI0013D9B13B|nr:hypothetical protein [Variovorax sp. WS11]NDZ14713.1 hypothetical protein [Variovorax sp. WS11]